MSLEEHDRAVARAEAEKRMARAAHERLVHNTFAFFGHPLAPPKKPKPKQGAR